MSDPIYVSSDSSESDVELPRIDLRGLSQTNSSSLSARSITAVQTIISTDNGNDKTEKKSNRKEKSDKKKQLAEERALKNQHNKIYKPGECMKYMVIELHPELDSAWYMSDLHREAEAAGVKVETAKLLDPALVMWYRKVPPQLRSEDGQLRMETKQRSNRALYLVQAETISESLSRDFKGMLQTIKRVADCELSVVVYGVRDYFKPAKTRSNMGKNLTMSEAELEMILADLLVSIDCDTTVVNTPSELALLVMQFTKAIAEKPYKTSKRELDEHAQFYMKNDSKNCIHVDAHGNGVNRLWQQMLAVLPMSSLEISKAISSEYDNPTAFYAALQSEDGVEALANVKVARSAAPGAKNRRIGPEFAKKMQTLFTSLDGDAVME